MCSHGRGKISTLMNKFLHEFLDWTPAIILTVLSCMSLAIHMQSPWQ